MASVLCSRPSSVPTRTGSKKGTFARRTMSDPRKDGGDGGGGGRSDLQLVPAVPPRSTGPLVAARAAGGETAIVEYGKGSGVVLREDEEELEVKLRRIIDNVPVRVSNTSGSSAGSGSGDFHQYRQMRRKEQDRLTRMDADYQRRKELAEYNLRREERVKAAEDRTAKKRAKRQKKKQRKKEKKSKPNTEGEPSNQARDDSSDDYSGDEHE